MVHILITILIVISFVVGGLGILFSKQVGLKSIFETDFKRHSEPRLPSTAQINH